MHNDPILALLLKGITDPAQREAIITAHATLSAGGASSLPGALAIYQARLIQVVMELAEQTSPTAENQQMLAAVYKLLKQVHEADVPQIEQAKAEIIEANLSTRRLRMSYVLLWMVFAAVAGASVGAYGVYSCVALTPQQEQWLAAGKQIGQPLTREEVDWMNFRYDLIQRHITVGWSDPAQGTFGIKVAAAAPYSAANVVQQNGQNVGVEAHWPDNGGGQ